MFGFGKPKPVKEIEATGEIERVYHEIKQSMRVSGINLNFRTWAGFDKFFSGNVGRDAPACRNQSV